MTYSLEFCRQLRQQVVNALPTCYEQYVISQKAFAKVQSSVSDKGVGVTHVLCGSSAWAALVTVKEIFTLLDPNSQSEDIERGFVAKLLGHDLITDRFDLPDRQDLPKNLLAMVSLDTVHRPTWSTDTPVISILGQSSIQLLIT